MKVREGFVSNSSSTSFFIRNTSDQTKTLLDFAKENLRLVREFNEEYNNDISEDGFLESAEQRDMVWGPFDVKRCSFGDEDGDDIGHVLDYMLREGGDSDSFSWAFDEYLR